MSDRFLLHGGAVADPSAAAPQRADVLFDGDGIEAVERLGPVEARVLDVNGMVVMPGLVDAHVHAEGPLLETGLLEGALRQGVTTVIVGQDGCGWAPGRGAGYRFMRDYFGAVNGDPGCLPPDGFTVGELLAAHNGRSAQNLAYLAPHGLLRVEAVGLTDVSASDVQLEKMKAALGQALADGAIGLSSGFDYIPSRFARHGELVELNRLVLDAGGVYVSHLDGYGDRVGAGLAGLAAVGADSGVPVHASHLWGPAELVGRGLADARERDVEISFDAYPYTAGSSLLSMITVPTHLQQAPIDAVVEALCNPAAIDAIRAGAKIQPEAIVLAAVGASERAALEGMTVAAAASDLGVDPFELIRDLLVESRMDVGVVFHREEITAADLEAVRVMDGFMAGSDGIYQGAGPHPRGFGTFTTLIESHLRRDPESGWNAAARDLALAAVERFGLGPRGRVRPGAIADLVVFDPARLGTRADYAEPRALAEGLVHAFIGGVPVVLDGALTGARPGAVIGR